MLMPRRSSPSSGDRARPRSGRRPMIASTSSVCPLPCTPAMPSTSPARTSRSTPSTARMPAVVVDHDQAGDLRAPSRPARPGSSSTSRLTLRPTISAASSSSRGVGVGGADGPAAPDHRDPVGDGLDLAQLVGDEDDRLAGSASAAHDREQLVGLLRGQHRGRLVEDEQVDVAGERLDDLDPLLRADRQVLDQRVRVDRQAVALGDLGDVAAGRGAGRASRAGRRGSPRRRA